MDGNNLFKKNVFKINSSWEDFVKLCKKTNKAFLIVNEELGKMVIILALTAIELDKNKGEGEYIYKKNLENVVDFIHSIKDKKASRFLVEKLSLYIELADKSLKRFNQFNKKDRPAICLLFEGLIVQTLNDWLGDKYEGLLVKNTKSVNPLLIEIFNSYLINNLKMKVEYHFPKP